MSRQKQENPPRVISTHIRPRFARLATAIDYSGVCRSKLYIAAAEHPGLFRKNGTAIVVDFDILDRVLDQLPVAKIKPPPAKKSKTEAV
jgi:hypothetical protein